eukprot:14079107-Heterocapsa_arctica.AAC.1
MDNPWESFDQARLIYRKAGAWTVQARTPPPAPIMFLGDLVLSVAKSESIKNAPRKPERPTPTATSWNAAPTCPAPWATRGAGTAPLPVDEDMLNLDNDERAKKSRTASPVREQAQAPAASAPTAMAARSSTHQNQQNESSARMDTMQSQILALMQQMAAMQHEASSRMDVLQAVVQRLVDATAP